MNHACSCAARGTTGNEGWKDQDIYFPVQISVASHIQALALQVL